MHLLLGKPVRSRVRASRAWAHRAATLAVASDANRPRTNALPQRYAVFFEWRSALPVVPLRRGGPRTMLSVPARIEQARKPRHHFPEAQTNGVRAFHSEQPPQLLRSDHRSSRRQVTLAILLCVGCCQAK